MQSNVLPVISCKWLRKVTCLSLSVMIGLPALADPAPPIMAPGSKPATKLPGDIGPGKNYQAVSPETAAESAPVSEQPRKDPNQLGQDNYTVEQGTVGETGSKEPAVIDGAQAQPQGGSGMGLSPIDRPDALDTDGDHYNDYAEKWAGTDPMRASAHPADLSPEQANNDPGALEWYKAGWGRANQVPKSVPSSRATVAASSGSNAGAVPSSEATVAASSGANVGGILLGAGAIVVGGVALGTALGGTSASGGGANCGSRPSINYPPSRSQLSALGSWCRCKGYNGFDSVSGSCANSKSKSYSILY